MARTPLMSFLRRLAADHAEAQSMGMPIEQVRVERKYRRRDFLKIAGIAAGTALMPRARPLFASTHKPRIAIVGAGIAGLNAALTLHDAGYASTIYESDSGFGGRIRSDTATWANNQVTEWCGEFIDLPGNFVRLPLFTDVCGGESRPEMPAFDVLLRPPVEQGGKTLLLGLHRPVQLRRKIIQPAVGEPQT